MTSTMQSIITPTIPTSAPFVFKSHPRLMLSDTVKTTMTDRQSYRLKTAELSQGSRQCHHIAATNTIVTVQTVLQHTL